VEFKTKSKARRGRNEKVQHGFQRKDGILKIAHEFCGPAQGGEDSSKKGNGWEAGKRKKERSVLGVRSAAIMASICEGIRKVQ